jgi:fermentation-respiration switch protein FrsA (DUF1100 family)
VYCHGNGEHVADQANLVFRLQSHLTATVFVFDYRGYGRSRGKPGERGCVADGMAAQRWLADREGVRTDEVVVIGRSIGGGVAVQMAAEHGARALVLENTFSRMTDAAAVLYPWLPVRLVMANRYDSVRRIRSYAGPLFQCHGTADDTVPIELGRRLFEASPSRMKKFHENPHLRHNDTLPPAYYAALAQFLDQVDQRHPHLPKRHRPLERQLVS